jgi:hypothetical protein
LRTFYATYYSTLGYLSPNDFETKVEPRVRKTGSRPYSGTWTSPFAAAGLVAGDLYRTGEVLKIVA